MKLKSNFKKARAILPHIWVKIILGILTLTGLMILIIYWFGWVRLPMSKVSAFEAIPDNTALILEFKDLETTLEKLNKTTYQEELKKLAFIKRLSTDFEALNRLFYKNDNLPNTLETGRMVVAAEMSEAETMDFIYIFDELLEPINLEVFVKTLKGAKVKRSTFSQRVIYDLILNSIIF